MHVSFAALGMQARIARLHRHDGRARVSGHVDFGDHFDEMVDREWH